MFKLCLKDDEPGWHNIVVVFGGQHRLDTSSEPQSKHLPKSFATISVFIDNAIVASLELPASFSCDKPDKPAPEFLQGEVTMTLVKNFKYNFFILIFKSFFIFTIFDVGSAPSTALYVKDVAYWRYALNCKHVNLFISSV